jgi:hypothetical protein
MSNLSTPNKLSLINPATLPTYTSHQTIPYIARSRTYSCTPPSPIRFRFLPNIINSWMYNSMDDVWRGTDQIQYKRRVINQLNMMSRNISFDNRYQNVYGIQPL